MLALDDSTLVRRELYKLSIAEHSSGWRWQVPVGMDEDGECRALQLQLKTLTYKNVLPRHLTDSDIHVNRMLLKLHTKKLITLTNLDYSRICDRCNPALQRIIRLKQEAESIIVAH